MQHLVICGDSFAVTDPEYGPMWVDLLGELLPQTKITNLAQVGASNGLISLQVDRALTLNPTHIAVLFTSSTRDSVRTAPSSADLLTQHQTGALVPYAVPTLTTLEPYWTLDQRRKLKSAWLEFRDLDWEIYLNSCVIESVLRRLADRSVTWRWDQGGFEHASFGGKQRYFAEFDPWRAPVCLWDLSPGRAYRPYYHITDADQHRTVAHSYKTWITGNNNE